MNAKQDKALYIRFMRGESMEELALWLGRKCGIHGIFGLLWLVESAIRRHMERQGGHAR